MKSGAIRLLIADDHKLFREGLRALLIGEAGIQPVGEARNGAEAVLLGQTLRPDIVLMDIDMPEVDGIVATRMLNEMNLGVKVLILSNFEDDERVYAAMKAGARGYVVKRIGASDLVLILEAVQNDEFIVSPYLANLILEGRRKDEHLLSTCNFALTDRELTILHQLVKGYSNKEISNNMYISQDTVKAHLKHIFEKLQVDCRTKAAIKALQYKIITHLEV